jgi:hypothetical protein
MKMIDRLLTAKRTKVTTSHYRPAGSEDLFVPEVPEEDL